MTREIKFKIWDSHSKYFIEGLDLSKGEYDDDRDTVTYQLDKVMGDRNPNGYRFTYLQYTGMLDKKRKPICEGDICRMPKLFMTTEDMETHFISKVIYDDQSSSFILMSDDGDDYSFSEGMNLEIIGNIYQNQELIK